MPIPTAAAANAYAALSRMGADTANIANGLGATQGSGPNFSAVLKTVIDSVSEAAQKSDAQAQSVANGKANMVDVVTAVAETETAVQTLVSVRDKVIAAYEDILKMQI
jgi:flagellar hook-basal body complex protein FliE